MITFLIWLIVVVLFLIAVWLIIKKLPGPVAEWAPIFFIVIVLILLIIFINSGGIPGVKPIG